MAETVTVNNLGARASERFAQDQELIKANPDLNNPHIIGLSASAAAISSTSPTPQSDFDELLNTATTKSSWAGFNPPENFNKSNSIFSYYLLPNIGPAEEYRIANEKIMQITAKNNETDKEKSKRLLSLIDVLKEKTDDHDHVSAKRNEYQKG